MSTLTWTELSSSPEPTTLLIALHGMGTNGRDLEPLAEELDLPHVRFIFPTAPLPMAPGAYQWYDLAQPEQDIPESVAALQRLVTEVQAKFGPLPVILLGFSQGAVMTVETGLGLVPRPLALVALSGYLYHMPELAPPPHPPIFIAHGVQDGVVSIRFGRSMVKTLTQAGLDVAYQEFPIGHGISLEVVQAIRQFLLPLLVR